MKKKYMYEELLSAPTNILPWPIISLFCLIHSHYLHLALSSYIVNIFPRPITLSTCCLVKLHHQHLILYNHHHHFFLSKHISMKYMLLNCVESVCRNKPLFAFVAWLLCHSEVHLALRKCFEGELCCNIV